MSTNTAWTPAYYNTTSPKAFAVKSLRDAEVQCAIIEWELLAVVYTFKCFQTYLYSHPFTVESDHKPLEIIILKI